MPRNKSGWCVLFFFLSATVFALLLLTLLGASSPLLTGEEALYPSFIRVPPTHLSTQNKDEQNDGVKDFSLEQSSTPASDSVKLQPQSQPQPQPQNQPKPNDFVDLSRPHYHFTTPQNWINDPNGPFYNPKTKTYHLFAQHNPYGPFWDHMTVGFFILRIRIRNPCAKMSLSSFSIYR
jgi:hypothetical protein